jgi:hypothetical protein
MEKDESLSRYEAAKAAAAAAGVVVPPPVYTFVPPYEFIPMVDTGPATPQELMNIKSATREMLDNSEKAFKASLTNMSRLQKESAISQKLINDREDKEKARQLLEEKKSATTKAAQARERGRALYEEHRQQGAAIVQAEKERAEEANRAIFKDWGLGGKGKRKRTQRHKQRKMKHKRYSSRDKRKSKSRR